MSNIENATWTRRLAYELGAFNPVNVPLPPLPPRAPDYIRSAYDGFRLLVGLRWADGEERPVAYAVRFAAAWCDLSFKQAYAGIVGLREARVIVQEGMSGRTPLFVPGKGT